MRKTYQATAVALAALLAGGSLTARAADMSMAPIYQPEGPMVEFGSGWYLRGDVGYATISAPTMSSGAMTVTQLTAPYNQVSTPFGGLPNTGRQNAGDVSATLGVGYQFNHWFRMDATYDYHQNFARNFTSNYQPGCYGQVTGPAPLNTPLASPCYRTDSETFQSWTGLLNVYGDLGNWFGVTPYIGGGVGLSNIQTSPGENWFWSNGGGTVSNQTYYSPAGTSPTTTPSATSSTTYRYGYPAGGPSQNLLNFSWALMAGLSYDIAPHVKLDVGYRYLNIGSVSAINAAGNTVRASVYSQEVRAGLRFTPDL